MPVQLTCVCAPSFLFFLRTSSLQVGAGNLDRMPWWLLNPVFLTFSSPVRHWFFGGPVFWETRLSSVCDNPQLVAAALNPLQVGQPPTEQQPWAPGGLSLSSQQGTGGCTPGIGVVDATSAEDVNGHSGLLSLVGGLQGQAHLSEPA